ncbi:MAG: hypothetical protein LBV00_00345 [Propionibacteriaceae bacterium]|jgi:antitoxin (DNA-binding transcriptional repressor) of toxin-antitoxin stability system|nr:hypothetical protein [Propionibacteriaceae bacterium]
MPTVGVRQFRDDLASYIDSSSVVRVTRHGQVVGVFIPQEPRRPFNKERFLAATDSIRTTMERAGITEDDVLRDFEAMKKGDHGQSVPRS